MEKLSHPGEPSAGASLRLMVIGVDELAVRVNRRFIVGDESGRRAAESAPFIESPRRSTRFAPCALFEKQTGYCVAGPCSGRSLIALPVRVEQGHVLLAGDADPEELAARYA